MTACARPIAAPPSLRVVLIVVLCLFASTRGVQAQSQGSPDQASLIRSHLLDQRYENISVWVADCVTVGYENRLLRYDVEALATVTELLAAYLSPGQCLELVPRNRGLDVISVRIPAEAIDSYVRGQIDRVALMAQASPSKPGSGPGSVARANPATFKLDVAIHPELHTRFGNFDAPVESAFNVVPTASTSFWKGMTLQAQMVVPMVDQLEGRRYIRPGIIVLNQWIRPHRLALFGLTAGHFSDERYGFDAETWLNMPGTDRLAFSVRAGYTGYASFRPGEWLYGDFDRTTWSGTVHFYALPRYALSIDATYGSYIYKDRVWRVDLRRAFGEVEIDFFGMHTVDGPNAGFRIAIPLPASHRPALGLARVRAADAFRWGYQYRGLTHTAEMYRTGVELENFWKALHPANLPARFERLEAD